MAFEITPQLGEQIYIQREFRGSHHHVFAMAVSNQALYLSAQKFAVNDTWHFKRVPLSEVVEVRCVKQRPFFMLLISVLMVVVGGIISFQMLSETYGYLSGGSAKGSGWPIAIFVGGFVVPFVSRGRKTLVVQLQKGKFKWRPQLAVDKKTRELCTTIQNEMLLACKAVGIRTSEV
jgi:hypothetical protein